MAPNDDGCSRAQLLEQLWQRYDGLSPSELAKFEALMTKHLCAVRPIEISFSFRNGVNRHYELVRSTRKAVVGPRQLRRRARDV